ncbi:polysaccharide deacetylase family protein [uncultured Olleya sp.]|uniref:polysaccharide deacetylase family protein n=1 Tax=uncultured Olleya sp. TaxID=757243 RepID=UPI002591EDDB|nr:polysaccharide deacetylase family protein [uncultured Olleya sp.]
MLLVYTHKITPRFKYVFKQICTRILGIPVNFTTVIEEFIAHDSLKMSYTRQPLSNEIFVRANELLFEQGLSDLDINVLPWEETKCFFPTGEKSALPFDVFAATFYLISRYEEYLPHVKDDYGRFTAQESLAFKNKFLDQPVVDIWAYKFKAILQDNYPDFDFPDQKYTVRPVIDIPVAYDYKLKGLMRTIGGTFKDFFTFKFKRLYQRYSVVMGFKRDPYDTYKYVINKQKTSKYKFVFFFLLGDFSTYDKNINFQKQKFISLIKHVGDYCQVGIKTSFFALSNIEILKEEKVRMERIINTAIVGSRHSFSKVNLPESYRHLVELEIPEDYTMGYVNYLGFRAGTCTPFLFYDLDFEVQTPLKIVPFQALDFAFLKYHSLLDKQQALKRLIQSIKQVNGTFVPVFHNYTFGNNPRWQHFKNLFNIIIDAKTK